MEFDVVSTLAGALIGGAIIGAITLKYVRWASSEMRSLRWSACHWATAYTEELEMKNRLIGINQKLGRALEAAGVPVQRVGECDCDDCAEEWPESIEVNQ